VIELFRTFADPKDIFNGKKVVLVDDSIVRGTTSRKLVQLAREAGASKVYFASAAPPIRYENVYGIDMPNRTELVAHGRDEEGIAKLIGADAVIYQKLDDLVTAVSKVSVASPTGAGGEGGGEIKYDLSCFNGEYVTGDVDSVYFERLRALRAVSKIYCWLTDPATELLLTHRFLSTLHVRLD
jgi:amidophosphoribosyltransferase